MGPRCEVNRVQLVQIAMWNNKLVYDMQVARFRWGYKPTNISLGDHPVGVRDKLLGGCAIQMSTSTIRKMAESAMKPIIQ